MTEEARAGDCPVNSRSFHEPHLFYDLFISSLWISSYFRKKVPAKYYSRRKNLVLKLRNEKESILQENIVKLVIV